VFTNYEVICLYFWYNWLFQGRFIYLCNVLWTYLITRVSCRVFCDGV